MPRVTITISLMSDESYPMTSRSWSPLGYEDLGNPNLGVIENTRINEAERDLLERLRTSIDRTLLSFARRERRRWAHPNVESRPNMVEAVIYDPVGELSPIIEQTPAQSMSAILEMGGFLDQPVVEDQRVPEPKKTKRARPIKRVSRYKRDPVI